MFFWNPLAFSVAAKWLQLCPTLCDPINGSPPGSPVSGIFQARTLEWVAISFSNAWKWKVKVKSLSRVRLLQSHGLQPTRLLCPCDFPGKSTGVGCHCLLHLLSLLLLLSCFSRVRLYVTSEMAGHQALPSLGFSRQEYWSVLLSTCIPEADSEASGGEEPGGLPFMGSHRVGHNWSHLAATEKARGFQKNIYLCFINYTKAFDCVDHDKLWKARGETESPEHLTCLLRNLCGGQEAAVRTLCGAHVYLRRIRFDVWQN